MSATKSASPNPKANKPAGDDEEAARLAAEAESNKPLDENSAGSLFIHKLVTGELRNPEGAEGKPPKKKKADEGAAEDGSQGDGGSPADEGGKPADPKKPKAKPTPPPKAIDEEALGAAVGRAIAPHLAKPKADAKDEDGKGGKDEDLSPANQKRVQVLDRMEKLYPERYTGLSKRFKQNVKKLRDYASKWEAEHPGTSFNEDDPEHQDFRDALEAEVAYEDEDFDEARIDLRAEAKINEKSGQLEQRIAEIERTDRARNSSSKVEQFAAEAESEFWGDVGGDFAKVIDTASGRLDKEQVEALKKADPVAFNIVAGAANAAQVAAKTVYMLDNDLVKFNKQNDVHVFLNNFLQDREQRMANRSPEEQMHEGKRFAPRNRYNNMSEEERARYWTFDSDDLRFMLRKHFARVAKADLKAEDEKFSARAKAKGLIADDDEDRSRGGRQADRRAETPEEDETVLDGKPDSPTAPTSPILAAGKGIKGGGAKTAVERFNDRFLQ